MKIVHFELLANFHSIIPQLATQSVAQLPQSISVFYLKFWRFLVKVLELVNPKPGLIKLKSEPNLGNLVLKKVCSPKTVDLPLECPGFEMSVLRLQVYLTCAN